jgi:hypothetical protein
MAPLIARMANAKFNLEGLVIQKGSFVRKGNASRKKSAPEQARTGRSEQVEKPAEQRSGAAASPSASNVSLTLKHFQRRREKSLAAGEDKRLYLRVGDEVNHIRYEEWGLGVVMEIMTSSIPGGTCLARVRFQDGQLRCFNNDLDNEACCYYFGVRRYWNPTHGVDAIRQRFFGRG